MAAITHWLSFALPSPIGQLRRNSFGRRDGIGTCAFSGR
jgi:hypothetical protein